MAVHIATTKASLHDHAPILTEMKSPLGSGSLRQILSGHSPATSDHPLITIPWVQIRSPHRSFFIHQGLELYSRRLSHIAFPTTQIGTTYPSSFSFIEIIIKCGPAYCGGMGWGRKPPATLLGVVFHSLGRSIRFNRRNASIARLGGGIHLTRADDLVISCFQIEEMLAVSGDFLLVAFIRIRNRSGPRLIGGGQKAAAQCEGFYPDLRRSIRVRYSA